VAEILADRLGERPDNLQVRIIAAAVAAAVWVAIEEWQAQDGEGELGALIDQALGTVLDGPLRATPTPSTMSEDSITPDPLISVPAATHPPTPGRSL
jgi:hypothetical protein